MKICTSKPCFEIRLPRTGFEEINSGFFGHNEVEYVVIVRLNKLNKSENVFKSNCDRGYLFKLEVFADI